MEIVIDFPLHIPPDTIKYCRKKKKNEMKMSTIISVLSLLIFFNFFSLKCFTLKHIVFLIILSILIFFPLIQFSHLILSIFYFEEKLYIYLFHYVNKEQMSVNSPKKILFLYYPFILLLNEYDEWRIIVKILFYE